MAIIERSRRLSPSTRKPESSYRVDTNAVGPLDKLQLAVMSEPSEAPLAVLEFDGADLANRSSIHFIARQVDGRWQLRLVGARPMAVTFGAANKPLQRPFSRVTALAGQGPRQPAGS